MQQDGRLCDGAAGGGNVGTRVTHVAHRHSLKFTHQPSGKRKRIWDCRSARDQPDEENRCCSCLPSVCVCIWANMWVYILCLCIGITNRKHNGTWFTLNKNKTKINGTRVRIVPPTNFADWSTIYIVQLLQLSCNVGTTFSLTMPLKRFFHCKLQALIRQYSLFLSMITIAAIAVASKITFRYL